MTTYDLRLETLSIPGVAEKTILVSIPTDNTIPMVALNPQGSAWGGLFDLDKALLMRNSPAAPPRSALQQLANLIRELRRSAAHQDSALINKSDARVMATA